MKEGRMTIRLKQEANNDTSPLPLRPKRKRRFATMLIVALVAVAAIGGGAYFSYTFATEWFGSPKADLDVAKVVARVGLLMLLPNEEPTIATVSDLSKLKDQPFFTNAKQNDIVLMFPRAQKAVLYNPTLNKIIEVAPITNVGQ